MTAEHDIIIVHWGGTREIHDLALQCLESIRKHTDPSAYRLIWIDNGSPLPSEAIEAEIERHPHEIVRNTENLGFTKATNQGLRISTAPHIVCFNNDAEAAPLWLEKLRACFTGNVGIVGPRTTNQNQWQGRYWARTPTLLSIRSMLAFFAVMIKRQVLDTVGYLDESYADGFGGDDAYCRCVHEAGFRLALAGDLVIPHKHRTSFKALYSEEEIRVKQETALRKFFAEG